MEAIHQADDSFQFQNISLAVPTGIQGGAYFTKIVYKDKPLYVETPKCLTKQGFVKHGKKIYSDLMFDHHDESFIQWIENLETRCHQLIYDNADSWFQNKLELDDIESAFTSPLKVYKSGKFYLLRTNVKMNYSTNYPYIKIYNEHETPLTIDDVTHETNLISIIEVQGIKFTSKNFQIEIELKQCMVLNSEKIFEQCLIKKNKIPSYTNTLDTIKEKKVELEVKEELNPVLEHLRDVILEQEATKEIKVDVEEKEEEKEEKEEDENNNDNSSNNPPEINIDTESFDAPALVESGIEELYNNDTISTMNDELEEYEPLDSMNHLETITLKKPNQVYYEIYKEARKKAKKAKKEAIVAFLEAKNIKKTYILEDLDESDDEIDEYSDSDLNEFLEE